MTDRHRSAITGEYVTAEHAEANPDTTVRGYVYRVRRGTWQWQVLRGGKLIATDNTGDWRAVYDECRQVVAAFRLVESRGHTTKPTREHGKWLASLQIHSPSLLPQCCSCVQPSRWPPPGCSAHPPDSSATSCPGDGAPWGTSCERRKVVRLDELRHCTICGRPSAFINDQGRCTRPACRETKA